MQQGDYSSYYQYPANPNPNLNPTQNPLPPYPPNPASLAPPSYASAPPYSATSYTEYSSSYPSSYPSYHQNPDPPPPPPPTAPSFSAQPTPPPVHQPQFASSFPQFETHGSYQQTPQPQPQPQPHHQTYYPTYDQFQPPQPNYSSPSPYPNPKAVPTSPYSSSLYPPSSATSAYDSPYDGNYKMDQSGGVVDDLAGRYGSSRRERSDFGSYGVEAYGEGVYAYQGSKVEPYGARGTAPKSSTWSSFDDFGRPIGNSTDKNRSSGSSTKIVKAVPKAEIQHDANSGVQKFRVKLLAESGGQSTIDVLCQIGLDGIRMLDPSTSLTLRIYPLDTVTRCETTDSSILSFWSKTSVDIEPRRIRLQSNSYTTSTLLDTVTAAIVQFKEMGGRSRPPPESSKIADQPTEKKKGFADWMNFMKATNEEKDYWVPDEAVAKCTSCGTDFNAFVRRHHCRNCGDVFCDKCTQGRIALTAEPNAPSVRVCDRCMAEVSHRLSNAKETYSRSSGMPSHEDLAKKLHEEMERNRILSSGSKPNNSSGKRMKEVACPTCTVHLQVQVPSSGSETIECGVCQHPFLVSAH